MLKKILIVSVLFLLIVSFSNTARAAIQITNPYGYYQINGGSLNASINFPKIITISVKVPNVTILKSLLAGCFVFDYWSGGFGEDLGVFGIYTPADLSSVIPGVPLPISTDTPIWVGQWEMTGPGKFSIAIAYLGDDGFYHILPDKSDLAQYINDLLSAQSGIINMIQVTIPKFTFSGIQDTKKDTLKVSFSLTINVDAVVTTGTITLTGSFTTSPGTINPPAAPAGIFSATDASAKATSKDLGNWVVDIIKALPLKDAVPAN
ncbi:MAG: hypothetical protein ABSB22_17060 [Thermodesulfobacteriota bacterium]|jgi:hypothetical protein